MVLRIPKELSLPVSAPSDLLVMVAFLSEGEYSQPCAPLNRRDGETVSGGSVQPTHFSGMLSLAHCSYGPRGRVGLLFQPFD